MKNALVRSLALAGIVSCAGIDATQGEQQTLAHFQIAAERSLGATTNDIILLEEFLSDAQSRIQKPRPQSHEYAVATLRKIDEMLKQHCFFPTKEGADLLSQALRTRKVDCDLYTSLYMSIAQRCSLPLVAVECPEHMFVRWKFPDGKYINWETTQGLITEEEDYKKYLYRVGAPLGRHPAMPYIRFQEFSPDAYAAWIAVTRYDYCSHLLPRIQRPALKEEVHTLLVKYLSEQIEKKPFSLERMYLRGIAYETLGMQQEAISDYRIARSYPLSIDFKKNAFRSVYAGKLWKKTGKK